MPGDHRLGSRFRLGRDGIEFWRWTVRGVVGSLTRHQNGCQTSLWGIWPIWCRRAAPPDPFSNVAQARSSYGLFTARWRSCAASIGLNVIAIPAVGEYLTLLWFSSGEGIKVSGTVVCLDALHDLGVVRPGILG